MLMSTNSPLDQAGATNNGAGFLINDISLINIIIQEHSIDL